MKMLVMTTTTWPGRQQAYTSLEHSSKQNNFKMGSVVETMRGGTPTFEAQVVWSNPEGPVEQGQRRVLLILTKSKAGVSVLKSANDVVEREVN